MPFFYGARGGAGGWGTELQAGRSRVRFSMASLGVCIDLILLAALTASSSRNSQGLSGLVQGFALPFTIPFTLLLGTCQNGNDVADISEVRASSVILSAFAKLREATISFVMSVRPSTRLSAWNNSAPTGWISWNLIFEYSSKICPEISSFIKMKQEKNVTLYEYQYTLSIISRTFILIMKNVSGKICRETRNAHFFIPCLLSKIVSFIWLCGKIL